MTAATTAHTSAALLAELRKAAAAGDAKAAAFLPTFEPFALVEELLERLSRAGID